MVGHKNGSPRVKTARRVFDIIELVCDAGAVGTLEVSTELGIAKSTAHGYLMTLEEQGWLVRDGDQFRIGSIFLKYGRGTRESLDVLGTVEPTLRRCAEETGETVWYVTREQGRAVYVSKEEGRRASRTNGAVGKQAPLHASACGKVILADQPDGRLDEIDLPQYTAATITTRDELRKEIAAVREDGIAYNDGETSSGLRAVACPIRADGRLLGAITVSGPEGRLRGDVFREELPTALRGAASEIELNHSSPTF